MKKLYLLMIAGLILTQSSLFSQDVGLPSMTYPIQNQRVHLQYTYDIAVVVKNYGPNAVGANSGMSFNLLYDGVSQGNFQLNTHPKINVGDSLEVSINGRTFSTPNSTLDVCVILDYPGDITKTNDTICNELRFSVDNNVDLGPSFIDIVAPDVDSVIKPGESIYLMKIDLTNYGTVTLPENDSIRIETEMMNQTKGPFRGITTTALDTGGTFTINAGGQQPNVPNNPGPFQICARLIDITKSPDKNSNNDEYCQFFYAYDWTGIPEVEESSITSYSFEKDLYLQNLNHERNVIRIFNLEGKLMDERILTDNSQQGVIKLNHLNSGVYVIHITEKGKVVHSNKFTID